MVKLPLSSQSLHFVIFATFLSPGGSSSVTHFVNMAAIKAKLNIKKETEGIGCDTPKYVPMSADDVQHTLLVTHCDATQICTHIHLGMHLKVSPWWFRTLFS